MTKHFTILFVCTISYFMSAQTTYNWLDTAPDANWSQGAAGERWSGGFFDAPPFGILSFDNNHELNMTNNTVNYNTHQLIFGVSNTSTRTLNGNALTFFDFGGANPKIENYASTFHTLNFDITGDDNGDALQINPIGGNIVINGNINTNGSFIDVFGDNGKALTINGLISGLGGIALKQNSILILNNDNSYSGGTFIEAGTLILRNNLANSDVTVSNGATLIIDDLDVTIKSLTVDTGGIVTISKAESLIILEDLIVNGEMTLESDSDEYSSLLVNGTTTGQLNYQRHINTTSATSGNDLISAPVFGQAFNDFITNNPNIVSDPNSDLVLFGRFNKSTDTYEIWNENDTTILTAGTGYRTASTDSGTFTFQGNVVTEDVSVNAVNSNLSISPWNLIGNPYPSYMSAIDFLNTNLDKLGAYNIAVYGYDGNASNGWVTLNYLTGIGTNLTPGQGFFIVIDEAPSQTLDFTTAMRRTSGGDDFVPGDTDGGGNEATLKLQLTNNTQTYETDFYFNEISTLGLDPGYDAGIYGNFATVFSLYSQLVEEAAGVDITIQSLPYSSINDVIIPLGINVDANQSITVSIQNSTIPSGINIYLEDTLNGTLSLLNSENFTLETNEIINGIGRFFLRFTTETLSSNTFTQDNALSLHHSNSKNIIYVNGLLNQKTTAKVYDLYGRLIIQQVLDNTKDRNTINTSSLKGVYIVVIENTSFSISKKIIAR